MNNEFPRILSLLRKERGLTQKQVATDLDVAQALLSHYEKGKRECGLEFLVKAADYYNVSTDYLLGRSPVSSGEIITEKDIPETNFNDKNEARSGDLMLTLNKKLIINSVEIIFNLLGRIKSTNLTKSISSMLMLSVYKAFRITHLTNTKNDKNIFRISAQTAPYLINSAICVDESKAVSAARNENSPTAPSITTSSIEEDFEKRGTALLSLIKNTESRILNIDKY